VTKQRGIVIAIDGPAGSGKSTTARDTARRLGYTYLDTGAMYRAVALAVLNEGGSPDDAEGSARIASQVRIGLQPSPEGQRTLLNGEDVSAAIRANEVSGYASRVSVHPGVREVLVAMQQEIGLQGGIVAEGRDTGTVVFPGAELKVFMMADATSRARRRAQDLAARGDLADEAAILKELEERDARDEATQERTGGWRAADAVEVDTTRLTIEGQVDRVVELAVERGAEV